MNTGLTHSATVPSSAVLSFLRTQIQTAFKVPVARYRSKIRQHCGSVLGRRTCHNLGQVREGKNKDHGPLRSGILEGQCLTVRTPLASRAPDGRRHPFRLMRRTFSNTSLNNMWNPFGLATHRRRITGSSQQEESVSGQQVFSGSLGRIMRPTNELKMRCTELDEHGNVTLVSGEFKKSELIAKYGLLPRDLRKIDSSLLPHILVRPSAILINLLNLRVLLKHNRVLVFDAYGTTDSKSQSVFMYDLDLKLRQKESAGNNTLAYEFRALEAVLISVTMSLEKEFEGVSDPVVRVLRELEEDIDRDKLRYLLVYSKKIGTFEQKARLVRNALEELLEADDDLSAMYLTEKAHGKSREDNDHTEVEMMLESYHKVADEIAQAAENLVSNIRNTEEIVRAILDANRNSLMLLDLKFSILTLSITAGTFVAALYGMNLKNFIEETDFGFYSISAWCTAFGFMVAVYGLRKLRRVQIMNMYGYGPNMGRGQARGDGWGLGAWGGRSVGSPGSRTRAGREECTLEDRASRRDALTNIVTGERALARMTERAEAKNDDAARR